MRVWLAQIATYLVGVTVLLLLVWHAALRLVEAVHKDHTAIAALTEGFTGPGERRMSTAKVVTGHKVLFGDDWMQSIRSESFWRGTRSSLGARPGSSSIPERAHVNPVPMLEWLGDGSTRPGPPADWRRGRSGTFRTVCVRLCDGFFWPISFQTTADNFERDAAACERSCSSPVRLFMYRNPGEDVEDLVDIKGQPYAKLKTANLFRRVYDESCKCRPHPWEEASLDKHRLLALEAQRMKGNREAIAQAEALRAKIRQNAEAARKAQVAAAKQTSARAVTGSGPRLVEIRPVTGTALSDAGAQGGGGLVASPAPAEPATDVQASAPVVQPRQRSTKTSRALPGAMRLGAGADGASQPKAAPPAARPPSSDWMNRFYNR